MILVDTNILIHLLTDEPKQAVGMIEPVFETAGTGNINVLDAVVVETCTVLQFNPRFMLPRRFIQESLDFIFTRPEVSLSPTASRAFELYKAHPKLDITDCFLAASVRSSSDTVFTFDKQLQKILK